MGRYDMDGKTLSELSAENARLRDRLNGISTDAARIYQRWLAADGVGVGAELQRLAKDAAEAAKGGE